MTTISPKPPSLEKRPSGWDKWNLTHPKVDPIAAKRGAIQRRIGR